jgi:hypothetical protein
MTGAQFEISIDDVPRTYRDRKDIAGRADPEVQKSQQCCQAERLGEWGSDRHRVQGGTIITECSPDWLKFNNPEAPAVQREAEEDWGRS